MTVIPAALDLAEDVLLPALRLLGAAWWGVAPATAQVTRRLRLPDSDPEYLPRFFVAQHQDGGGALAPVIGDAGWQGLVLITCYSASDARARDGRDRVHVEAIGALDDPPGYAIDARYVQPVARPSPDPDGIYGRATMYRITLRRI